MNAARRSFLLALVATGALSADAFAADKTLPAATVAPLPPPRPPVDEFSDPVALDVSSGMGAADFEACVSDLRAAHVVFEPLDKAEDAGCALSGAVRLASVATPFGDVAIAGKPTMLCSFARQFSRWSRDVAAPLTFADTGRKLAEIEGSAFACRPRTDKPGAIPSEHAKGNAIDIGSFVLVDHSRIRVGETQSDIPMAHELTAALRTTACGYFTTVLGPGANAAHADHLHFDLAVHGATANFRICE